MNDNRLGRCETAIELYAQLPSYAEEGVEPRSMVPKYNLWGLSLQSAGRYEDSLEPFNLALAAAEESGEVDKVQSTLQLLAQSQLALNHYAEAGELLQRAIELEGPDVLITDRLAPQRTLAGLYMLTDRNTEALSLLQDAIGGIEEIETSALGEELKAYSLDEMRTQKVLTLAMQADMLIQMGNPQQALEYLLQTDVLNKGVKWLLPYEDMTLPLAQAYLELGRWQDAEARLEMNTDNEALELLPDLGQNNPDLLRLRGEIELARGNLQQAGDYLQSALEACSPVSNELPLMPKAAILRDMGRLAELSGDLTGAEEKYRLAMDELLAIASAVPWNTLLTGGLAEEIYDAGQSLIELYESQGRTQEADEVRNTLDQVKTAAQFIRNYSSISNDDADAAFRQYRTINTHLETLRYKLHYDLGAGVDNFDQKYEQLQDAQGLPRKYRKEQLEQISTLRQELEEKVIGLEQEAAAKLAELRELDPEAAAIIELK
ncbi:MAG: tetratricopeptide repeat protein [bacterium]